MSRIYFCCINHILPHNKINAEQLRLLVERLCPVWVTVEIRSPASHMDRRRVEER